MSRPFQLVTIYIVTFLLEGPLLMTIRGAIWQFPVSLDIQANLKAMIRGLQAAEPETLLVMPEGAISGYAPE